MASAGFPQDMTQNLWDHVVIPHRLTGSLSYFVVTGPVDELCKLKTRWLSMMRAL